MATLNASSSIAPALSLSDHTIEVVRGRMSDAVADELVAFWTSEGALEEAVARERLADVVCVLRDRAGAIAGVNSVFAAKLDAVGGRTFWIYRSFLPRLGPEVWPAMANHAFLGLQGDYRRTEPGPVGVCWLVDDADFLAQHPEALWLWPISFYAGHLPDGRRVQIRYFEGASIGPPRTVVDFGTTIDRGYRIDLFAEQDAVDRQAVIDLWEREGAVTGPEAERRVDEVLLVTTHEASGQLAAVATVYLEHNDQLRMDFWNLRTFVAKAHRMSRLAWTMMMISRDHLRRAFMGGLDTRGNGVVLEIENESLMWRFDEAIWLPSEFLWIGESRRGDHVRVHYFPGALAPGPPS